VTAVELSRDYQNNEVAADNRYQDKLLEVRGTVVSIDKGVFDEVIVQLSGGSEQDAHAFMAESEKTTAAALRKGKAVTVLCHGGGMTLGSPMLKDCTFANSTDSGDDLAQNAKKSKWIVQCLCDGRVFAYQKLLRARNKAGALDKACTDVCEDRSGSLGGRMNVNLNVCKRQCIHGSIEPYASCEWHVNRDGQSN